MRDRIVADVRGRRSAGGERAGQRVAVDEAGLAVGQRRVGGAVGAAERVGGDCQRSGVDRQRRGIARRLREAEAVVVAGCRKTAAVDRIGAHVRGAAGARGEHRRAGGHTSQRVAVDEAIGRSRAGEPRGRHAIGAGRRRRGVGHRQRCRIDGEVGAGEAQRVVAARRQRALRDRIGADVRARRRGSIERARQRVAIDEAGLAVGQRRVRCTIGAAERVGGDRQRRRIDRQRARHEVQVIALLRRIEARDRSRIGTGIGLHAVRDRGGAEDQRRIGAIRQRVAGNRAGLAVVGERAAAGRHGDGRQEPAQQRIREAVIHAPSRSGAAGAVDVPAIRRVGVRIAHLSGGQTDPARAARLAGRLRVPIGREDRVAVRSANEAAGIAGTDNSTGGIGEADRPLVVVADQPANILRAGGVAGCVGIGDAAELVKADQTTDARGAIDRTGGIGGRNVGRVVVADQTAGLRGAGHGAGGVGAADEARVAQPRKAADTGAAAGDDASREAGINRTARGVRADQTADTVCARDVCGRVAAGDRSAFVEAGKTADRTARRGGDPDRRARRIDLAEIVADEPTDGLPAATDGAGGAAVGDGPRIDARNGACAAGTGYAGCGQPEVAESAAHVAEQADHVRTRTVDHEPRDRVALTIEGPGEARTADGQVARRINADWHEARTAVPDGRGRGRNVVGKGKAGSQQGVRTDALKAVDVADLIGGRDRAITAGGTQEAGVARVNLEVGGRKRRQARADLRPAADRKRERADIDGGRRIDQAGIVGRPSRKLERAIGHADGRVQIDRASVVAVVAGQQHQRAVCRGHAAVDVDVVVGREGQAPGARPRQRAVDRDVAVTGRAGAVPDRGRGRRRQRDVAGRERIGDGGGLRAVQREIRRIDQPGPGGVARAAGVDREAGEVDGVARGFDEAAIALCAQRAGRQKSVGHDTIADHGDPSGIAAGAVDIDRAGKIDVAARAANRACVEAGGKVDNTARRIAGGIGRHCNDLAVGREDRAARDREREEVVSVEIKRRHADSADRDLTGRRHDAAAAGDASAEKADISAGAGDDRTGVGNLTLRTGKPALASEEIGIGDIKCGRDEAARDGDDARLRDGDPVRVDQKHAAVGRDGTGNGRGCGTRHAVERGAVGIGLVEHHLARGADIEALPVDHRARAGLVDRQHVARCRDRSIAGDDTAADRKRFGIGRGAGKADGQRQQAGRDSRDGSEMIHGLGSSGIAADQK